MRYVVKARPRVGKKRDLWEAIVEESLGEGSVAGDEYLRDMANARVSQEGVVSWVEVCFCATPLEEERPYWEEFFVLESVKNAHARTRCKDETGEEPWACVDCDCTQKLEARMAQGGEAFLEVLAAEVEEGQEGRK